MRLLTVRHITVYRYAQAVRLGEHRMMFRPRVSHDLRLVRSQLVIHPQPARLRWLHDVFDNSVAVASFEGTTSQLSFESTVTLVQTEVALPDYQLDSGAEMFPFHYGSDDQPDLTRALQRIDPDAEVDRWARAMVPQGGQRCATLDLLRAMTLRIQETFTYLRRTERGVQSPAATLRRGSGTCRDFAWLMIDAVRSLGFAARFVSGYLFVPGPDPMAMGGGATHAWLQVYLPGAGWVDFDPTNSIIGNRNLIRVAVGWNPTSVLPLWGTFTGPPGSAQEMLVDVTVTEEIKSSPITEAQGSP